MRELHSELCDEISSLVTELLDQSRLTLSSALALIEQAQIKARELQVPMVICVVDSGGNLIAQQRMDNALLASIELSYAKAYSATALRGATADLAKEVLPGRPLYGLCDAHPGRYCLFGGGIPLTRNGVYVGAIGVSGGTVEEDTAVAAYALEHFV